MKKTLFAALALVAMASCAKESATTTTSGEAVAAEFKAASITRVSENAWEANDKIGISMAVADTYDLADGDYLNVPHTVGAAGVSGTFAPDSEVVYFPVDGSAVDFYAYYPYAEADANNDIEMSVATQDFSAIDVVATKARSKSKIAPTVTFSGAEAFAHQLSKLTITLKAGEGITSLAGVTTKITGQYTTADFNILTGVIKNESGVQDIAAVSAADGSKVEAILIPTEAIAGSTIVFTLDGDDYVWKTDDISLVRGSEHSYEITVTKTGVVLTGATILDWNEGVGGSGTAE